jgi:hypothetical protein
MLDLDQLDFLFNFLLIRGDPMLMSNDLWLLSNLDKDRIIAQ